MRRPPAAPASHDATRAARPVANPAGNAKEPAVNPSERETRLRAELEALQLLKQQSSVFDFESGGDPPDRYTVSFRGKGVVRDSSSSAQAEPVEIHRCDVRLPYSYPERPPDIRWLTPIFHPNVSISGFVNMRDVGLHWDKNVGLDAVLERLWDVARLAYIDADKATNFAARNWMAEQKELRTPVDPRPLRDRGPGPATHVVKYSRQGAKGTSLASAGSGDVLYIGEETPTPETPRRRPPPPPRRDDGGEVIYIGDE
jgi:ubiquitin-protein ligase